MYKRFILGCIWRNHVKFGNILSRCFRLRPMKMKTHILMGIFNVFQPDASTYDHHSVSAKYS